MQRERERRERENILHIYNYRTSNKYVDVYIITGLQISAVYINI